MNPKDFFDTVVKMRELQKKYLKERSPFVFSDCKKQEKIIDDEVKRVNRIVEKDTQLRFPN